MTHIFILPKIAGASIQMPARISNNIPNIKAYWIMLGIKIAQISQNFGSNDFDGTVTEEKIYHMAGSETPNALTIKDIKRIITAANCEPVERTTLYDVIEENKGEDSALSHAV